jgi:hypothetical protein
MAVRVNRLQNNPGQRVLLAVMTSKLKGDPGVNKNQQIKHHKDRLSSGVTPVVGVL